MELVTAKLAPTDLERIKLRWGSYVKVTADIVEKTMVVGPELHADAVPLLKSSGSMEENIWGGWVNLKEGEVETLAVWNIRPQLNNFGMEIMDLQIRERFINLITEYFGL